METHHRCPSILLIQPAVIFRRSLTVVVDNSLYFSSSLMGKTLANQNGNNAGSLGGWPWVSRTRCWSQLALLARMRLMNELPISRSSRVGVRSKRASVDSGLCAGIPLTVGAGAETFDTDVSSASRRSSSAVDTSSTRSTSPTE